MNVYTITLRYNQNPYVVLGHKSAGFIHARSMEDAAYILEKLAMFQGIVCIEPASSMVSFVALLKVKAHGNREGIWRGNVFTPFNVREDKLDNLLGE